MLVYVVALQESGA